MFKSRKLWQGLTFVATFLLMLSIVLAFTLENFRSAVDKQLGTTSRVIVSDDNGSIYSRYTPDSEFLNADGTGNSSALVKKAISLGRLQSAEGSVLLKNENGALPLDAGSKVTLLGLRSYVPILGMGTGASVAGGYIDLCTALSGTSTDFENSNTNGSYPEDFSFSSLNIYDRTDGAGANFSINPTAQNAYISYNNGLGTSKKTVASSPESIYYDPGEPTVSALTDYQSGLLSSFSQYGDAAIVTVARPSSENVDYGTVKKNIGADTPMSLTDNERAAIQLATENFDKVIVLINSVNTMEIEELKNNEDIDAILWIGFPGCYGMLGVADILCGRVSPSGGLADVYAVSIDSAPATQNVGEYTFSNSGSVGRNSKYYVIEAEGIYVGYRYYETRYYDGIVNKSSNANSSAGAVASSNGWNYSEEVSYSFGYGLTYSEGDLTYEIVDVKEREGDHEIYLDFKVRVVNGGARDTKANIQIYVQQPYTEGGVEKSAIQLLNYDKSELIPVGQSKEVTVTCDLSYMASYDNTVINSDGSLGGYILNHGVYYFAVGNGAHDALNNILAKQGKKESDGMDYGGNDSLVYVWEYGQERDEAIFSVSKSGVQVSNRLDYADYNYYTENSVTYLSRSDWEATYPQEYKNLRASASLISDLSGTGENYYTVKTDQNITLSWGQSSNNYAFYQYADVDFDDDMWDELLEQMSLEEAMLLAAYGGDSIPSVESIGLFECVATENAGTGIIMKLSANLDPNAPWAIQSSDVNYKWDTNVFACAAVIASSFNPDISYETGSFVGNEALFVGLPILWGPGMNLHRTAYNGRNGEYFSEDPVLTGICGMEYAVGARDKGLIVTAKHFAFNDQETRRFYVAPFMTEQRAREMDLRAFQIAVEATAYDNERGEDTGMIGVMASLSKIGGVECTCSVGLIKEILCGEWGFTGYAVTDITDDMDLYSSAIYAGVTGYDLRGSSNISYSGLSGVFGTQVDGSTLSTALYAGDNDMQEAIRESNKRMIWTLCQSNLVNRYNSSSRMVNVMTSWRIAYVAAIAVTAVLAVVGSSMYVLSVIKSGNGAKKSDREV